MSIHWPNGANVFFNPSKSPLDTSVFLEALHYALWIIKERTGIEMRYAGETSQKVLDGGIVVRFGDWDDFKEFGYHDYMTFITIRGIAVRTGYAGQPYLRSQTLINEMYIKPDRGMDRRAMRTLVHEMLHNAGHGHLETAGAVMHKNLTSMYPATYGLTCEDYMTVQRGGDHAFVELTRENDLWIPCVEGKAADLEYVGDGVTHKWRLRNLRDAGPLQVPSAVGPVNQDQPDLLLTDVRSPTRRFTNVQLKYSLETELWTLIHATEGTGAMA